MTRRMIVAGTVASIALCYADVYGEVKIMPEELLEVASRHNCVQITDFYEDRPGPVDPVYVYGYVPGEKWDSAVFWCKNPQAREFPYTLVFFFRKSDHELTRCPDRIDWKNPPGGLSVYLEKDTRLAEEFVYIKDPKRKVPKKATMRTNGIMSYYDGVEELFYCYKGEWLVRQRH